METTQIAESTWSTESTEHTEHTEYMEAIQIYRGYKGYTDYMQNNYFAILWTATLARRTSTTPSPDDSRAPHHVLQG